MKGLGFLSVICTGRKYARRANKNSRSPIPGPQFLILILLLFTVHCSLFTVTSCTRNKNESNVTPVQTALPSAILQTGEHPLWFQLTDYGPMLLETIEDAEESAAFVPWPLALHVMFIQEKDDGIVIVINRDGFLKIAQEDFDSTDMLAMYRFSGGNFWKQYTVGGFVYYNDEPTALLYLDDRFLESTLPLANPRTWSFNMKSNAVFSVNIPALELFPVSEGWNADTLRLADDGFFYYRVLRTVPRQEMHMLRTENLAQAGINISIDDFFHSAPKKEEIKHPSLPALPRGFVYTKIAHVKDNLFACWEEQEEFNIGAAGFMLIRENN